MKFQRTLTFITEKLFDPYLNACYVMVDDSRKRKFRRRQDIFFCKILCRILDTLNF